MAKKQGAAAERARRPAAALQGRAAGGGAGAEPRGTDASAPDGLPGLDEEVLADVAHDARNAFHKLYYLAERLAEDGGPGAEDSPAQMLGRVADDLDRMFQETLDYARPLALSTIAVTGAELAAALESWLRRDADGAEVRVSAGAGVAAAALRIDPGQLPRAIGIALRELARGAAESGRLARATAALEVAERTGGIEIRIEIAAGPDEPAPRKARRLLPWAMARRVIELHGGRIAPCGLEGAASGCIVELPLHA